MPVTLQIEGIPKAIPSERLQAAERKARELFVMELLREADISAGRAAEVLGIDRWTLSDLMFQHQISPFGDHWTREELEREARNAGPDWLQGRQGVEE